MLFLCDGEVEKITPAAALRRSVSKYPQVSAGSAGLPPAEPSDVLCCSRTPSADSSMLSSSLQTMGDCELVSEQPLEHITHCVCCKTASCYASSWSSCLLDLLCLLRVLRTSGLQHKVVKLYLDDLPLQKSSLRSLSRGR